MCEAGRALARLLVVASPSSPELAVLKQLPSSVQVISIGQELKDFAHLSEEQWSSVDVLLSCGVGKNAAKRENIQVCLEGPELSFGGRLPYHQRPPPPGPQSPPANPPPSPDGRSCGPS